MFFVSHQAWAVGAVSAATGGTGRATVDPGEALFLNAANLVHLRSRYFFSTVSGPRTALALSDSTTESIIPAGVAYMKESYEVVGGPSVEVSDLRISLADFVRDRLAIGFSLHQYSYSDPSARLTQNNFDLGLTFTPTPELGVALVGTNLAGEKESLPSDIRPTPRLSVGLNYIYRGFLRLRMDAETGRRMSTANPIIGLGYEAYINPFILFRFGHQSDNEQRAEFRSLGLGFDLPRFSMNYAYRSEVGGARKVSHLVDLAVPF